MPGAKTGKLGMPGAKTGKLGMLGAKAGKLGTTKVKPGMPGAKLGTTKVKPGMTGVIQPAIPSTKVAQLFSKFDADGSGKLDLEEAFSLIQGDPSLRKYANVFADIKNRIAAGTLGSQLGGAPKLGMVPAKSAEAQIQNTISRLENGGELSLAEFKKLLTDIDTYLNAKKSSQVVNKSFSGKKTKIAGQSKLMGSKKLKGSTGKMPIKKVSKNQGTKRSSISRSAFLKNLAAEPGVAFKVPGNMPGYDFGTVNPGEMTSGTTDLTTGIEFRKFAIDIPNKGVREYWVVGNPIQAEAAYKRTEQETGVKGMVNGPAGTKALKLELEGWIKDRSREKEESQSDFDTYSRMKEESDSDNTPAIDAVLEPLNTFITNRDDELASLQEALMKLRASDAAILS